MYTDYVFLVLAAASLRPVFLIHPRLRELKCMIEQEMIRRIRPAGRSKPISIAYLGHQPRRGNWC